MSDVHPSEAEGRTPTVRESIRVVQRMLAGKRVDRSQLDPEVLAEVDALVALISVPGPLAARSPAPSDEPVSAQDWKTQAEIAERCAIRATARADEAEVMLSYLRSENAKLAARIASLLPPETT